MNRLQYFYSTTSFNMQPKLAFSLFLAAGLFFAACKHDHKPAKPLPPGTAAKYQCPMDCEKGKQYEQAGACPVCKMDLVAVPKDSSAVH
jgi:Heavy metal binding domain